MKIGIISWAGCIRMIKESRMLAAAGHELWLFSHFQPQLPKSIDAKDVFAMMSFFDNPEVLHDQLAELDFLDICVVHNEPSWPVEVARKAGHKKVVLDAHDLNIVRYGWDKAIEMGGEDINAVGECDGLVVPCDRYVEIIEEKGKLRIPTLTLYSMVNSDDFVVPDPKEHIGGIVYAGSIYPPAKNHPMPYRIYDQVAKKILSMGIPFHIYPGRGYEAAMPFYESIGCTVHKTLDPKDLLKTLSKHDWCFCGSPVDHSQWHNTIANKSFDAIAAGVPQFIYQADATAKLLGLRGVGVVIENLSDIKDYYYDMQLTRDIKEMILKNRHEWTMESQRLSLEKFYQDVINTNLD